jgi:transcriptional regulator with XRE-family HTH domain
VTPGRRRRVDGIPDGQPSIVGVNIRILRQRKGWSQAKLGELMGWPSASTVCAAEGRRGGRQRGFTGKEIKRLAAIFDVSPRQLTTRCVNCGGHPPAGFACLACGAAPGQGANARQGDEGQRTVTTTDGAIASQEWSIPGPHTA